PRGAARDGGIDLLLPGDRVSVGRPSIGEGRRVSGQFWQYGMPYLYLRDALAVRLLELFESSEGGSRRHPTVPITDQSNEEGRATINFTDAGAELPVLSRLFRSDAPLQVNSGYSDITLQSPAIELRDHALRDSAPFFPEVGKGG